MEACVRALVGDPNKEPNVVLVQHLSVLCRQALISNYQLRDTSCMVNNPQAIDFIHSRRASSLLSY